MDDFLWRLGFQVKQYFYYIPREEGTFWIAIASLGLIVICGSIKVIKWLKKTSKTTLKKS